MSVNQGRVMDVHEIVNKLQKQATGRRNGEGPTGNIDIEQNGVYDVTDYAQATVQVPNTYTSGDEGKVVSNGALVSQTAHADVTPTTADQTIDTTLNNSIKVKGDADLVAGNIKKDVDIFGVIGSYEGEGGGSGFDGDDIAMRTPITGDIVLSTATSIKGSAFQGTRITSISGNLVTELGGSCLRDIPTLTSFNLPNVTTISTSGNYAFGGCSALTQAMMPKLATWSSVQHTFNGCTNLQVCDLGVISSMNNNTFNGCTALRTLILRRTEGVCGTNWANAAVFGGIYDNPTASTIYVPSALISDYEQAANWSTLKGMGVTFAAIENSIYE